MPCRVIADPTYVTFEWTFSSSGERFEVPHGHYATVQQPDGNGLISSNSAIDSNETHAAESIGTYIYNSNMQRKQFNFIFLCVI